MEKLKFIQEQLEALKIPYDFMEWKSDIVYPYFVGELTEEPDNTEDGLEQSTLLLNGFYRGKTTLPLAEAQKKIKKHFHPIHGLRAQLDCGAIAVFYEGAFFVPTNEADLKRIQINLKIKEWKGDF